MSHGRTGPVFAPTGVPTISEMVGMAAQAVGDGQCHTCLVIYPTGNLEGPIPAVRGAAIELPGSTLEEISLINGGALSASRQQ